MREKQAMQLHRNKDARARVRRCVFQINVPAGLDCFFLLVVFQLLMDPTFHRLIFPPNVPACLERTTPLESLLNRDGKAFRFIRRHVFFFLRMIGRNNTLRLCWNTSNGCHFFGLSIFHDWQIFLYNTLSLILFSIFLRIFCSFKTECWISGLIENSSFEFTFIEICYTSFSLNIRYFNNKHFRSLSEKFLFFKGSASVCDYRSL